MAGGACVLSSSGQQRLGTNGVPYTIFSHGPQPPFSDSSRLLDFLHERREEGVFEATRGLQGWRCFLEKDAAAGSFLRSLRVTSVQISAPVAGGPGAGERQERIVGRGLW